MGPTDGNLYALARYQDEVDAAERFDEAVEAVMEKQGLDYDDACTYLREEAISAAEDRAEALYEARIEARFYP